jgi:crotonobetainyl-CoA:carnitine CoA-transferase CaiB-like acyl-CoA transferase
VPEPGLGGETVRMQGVVPSLSATPGRVTRGGPLLGEHNDQVWGQFLTDQQRRDYRAQGVI